MRGWVRGGVAGQGGPCRGRCADAIVEWRRSWGAGRYQEEMRIPGAAQPCAPVLQPPEPRPPLYLNIGDEAGVAEAERGRVAQRRRGVHSSVGGTSAAPRSWFIMARRVREDLQWRGGAMCAIVQLMHVCMCDYIAVSTRALTPPTTGIARCAGQMQAAGRGIKTGVADCFSRASFPGEASVVEGRVARMPAPG